MSQRNDSAEELLEAACEARRTLEDIASCLYYGREFLYGDMLHAQLIGSRDRLDRAVNAIHLSRIKERANRSS